ncbi:unnamed protein product, partial [Scytosiphon promiscuus]
AGQRRDLVVKQAERVTHFTLVADISEIEKKLSDDEREYEATAIKRQEEQRRKKRELQEAAVQKVVSEASGKLSGTILGRMQGLAKLHESAESAMKLELGQFANAGKNGKDTSAAGESSASVHRCKVLKDRDLVPDDTVDDGEQDQVEKVLDGTGLDLSYLWFLDARNLGARSPKAAFPTGGSPSSSAKKQGSSSSTKTTAIQQARKQRKSRDGDRSSDGGDGWAETTHGGRRDATKDSSKSTSDQNSVDAGKAEFEGDGGRRSPDTSPEIRAEGSDAQPAKTGVRGDEAVGAGDHGAQSEKKAQQHADKKRGRLIPGSLVLASLSASSMPNTEKGVFSKQDPYLVVKWGDQEVRTSAKRDSGKDCSWPKEELALIVRTKKQLQEPIQVEVWNDNAGDKKPSPDVLIGEGNIPVKHLALNPPAAPASTIKAGGRSETPAAGERVKSKDCSRGNRRDDGYTDDEAGSEGLVVTVDLVTGERRRRKKANVPAGTVALTLEYTPPRRKPPKVKKEEEVDAAAEARAKCGRDERTATDTDDDNISSIADLSALSSKAKRNHLSVQELGAAMSQALEGFDIREELNKIECLEYAQGIINEGFGQRGAFADIQEEHLVDHPIYVPRGARKRILALAGLIRLQMKAEKDKSTKATEVRRGNGQSAAEGAFEGGYTVDGVTFFDTLAAMNASLEEDRVKADLAAANELIVKERKELPGRPKSPKPRSAAKEKINGWLDNADRFKNGAIPREAVKGVMRDALVLNGLPSPRESDARISLQRASIDDQGLHFDRRKLGIELEQLIRKELT